MTAVLALAAGALVAGCGSSSPKAGSTPPSSPTASSPMSPSASPTTTMTGTAAMIATNWVAFFNPKTPAAKKADVLQNGSQFSKYIAAQSSSPLASSVAAKVSSVTSITTSTATVHYSLYLGGTPALANQTGEAVYQGGAWKVGDKSFCGLLALENGKNGLPPACSSAS